MPNLNKMGNEETQGSFSLIILKIAECSTPGKCI